MTNLDSTNARILEILQGDARTSVSDIARQIQRAESTTRERIALLEKRGIVTGYRALVDAKRLGYAVHAVVRADCDMGKLPELARMLRLIPNVTSVHMTTGDKPIRIELFASDMTELEHVVAKRITPLSLHDLEIGLVVQEIVPARAAPVRLEGQTIAAPAEVPAIEPKPSAFAPVPVTPRMRW